MPSEFKAKLGQIQAGFASQNPPKFSIKIKKFFPYIGLTSSGVPSPGTTGITQVLVTGSRT